LFIPKHTFPYIYIYLPSPQAEKKLDKMIQAAQEQQPGSEAAKRPGVLCFPDHVGWSESSEVNQSTAARLHQCILHCSPMLLQLLHFAFMK
jgi:hypothetical protein